MSDPRTRLTYLLSKYANKQASGEEIRELSSLLERDWEATTPQEAPGVDWENMLETIKTEGQEVAGDRLIGDQGLVADEHLMADRPVRILGTRGFRAGWFRAAAAVFVLLAAGTVFFVTRGKKEMVQLASVPADVLPGGNKAVLTLAGGRQIILDSAHSGSLAVQGNARVNKLGGGQLSYQAIADSAGADDAAGAAGGTAGSVVYNTLSTPKGGQYELTLPDGTHVWLNAASSVTYPTSFVGNTREVTMTGEAYFEVKYNAKQPFRVKVGNSEIEDLGTHFNINAYADESVVRTTLLEGKVAVRNGGERRVLIPGQQADVAGTGAGTAAGKAGAATSRAAAGSGAAAGAITVRSGVDVDEAVAWKNGLFQFTRADIRTVMRQIARWYDVDVRFEGPVSDDRFWGKLPRDANASQVLHVLQKEQVHFRIEGKTIIVTK